MRVPPTAVPIVEARKRGLKPAEMVVISLTGYHPEIANPQVVVGSGDYDWFWVRGLQVCLIATRGTHWRQTLEAIEAHCPAKSLLWDDFEHQGYSVLIVPEKTAQNARIRVSGIPCNLDFIEWTQEQNLNFEFGI